jgi:hypothetical protein
MKKLAIVSFFFFTRIRGESSVIALLLLLILQIIQV